MWHFGCGRGWGNKSAVLLFGTVCLLGLAGCGGQKQGEAQMDILTQKVAEDGRTQITVMVKIAFTIDGFEEALEARFPSVDLVQVGNYSPGIGFDEYERRLKNDDLTDLVMTWPLHVGEAYLADRLLDLSGYEFTSRYNISMLNAISKEGSLYYVPGPAQVRGIVYNKTLFAEKGWQVPTDYEGFVALCRTIEASGMRSLQLGFKNAEVLDTAFIGYNYANYFSKPQDSQWIADYNQGNGSFGDHFDGALDVFQEMIDAGVFKASDLDVDYAAREKLLFTRQCAMVEDSVLLTRMGGQVTGSTDEFALMPFFNPAEDSDWARLYMVCYVGVNKHLGEPQNKEKLELVLQIMDYISTPEGQEALAADTGAMFSSLVGVAPPGVPEIVDLVPALSHGRYAIFPQLQNAQGALQEGLAGMLRGEAGKADVIRMVDEQNKTPLTEQVPEVLGIAEETFTLIETGNYITDTMQAWSGCDIALYLDNGKDGRTNGKGLNGRIYKGEITDVDIACIMPDYRDGETGAIWRITMSGADLKKTLEYSIPVDNNQRGWFYYFSGLKMTYDPAAEPGSRIREISMADGSPVDDEQIYSLAVIEKSVPEEYIQECSRTDTGILELLMQGIRAEGSISPDRDDRFITAAQ